MTRPIGLPIERARAAEWMRKSLIEGSPLSQAIAYAVNRDETAEFIVLVDESHAHDIQRDFEGSYGISSPRSHELLGALLLQLAELHGAVTVFLEDEFWRPRNRGKSTVVPPEPVIYVGDRQLLYLTVGRGQTAVAHSQVGDMMCWSSGWPSNSFVCAGSADTYSVRPGESLSSESQQAILDGVVAASVAAFHAETYVVWLPGSQSPPRSD